MIEEKLISEAEFTSKVCVYWLMHIALTLTVTVVGIPLLFLWLPLGLVFTTSYLRRMECVLTNKSLKVKKGMLVRIEKTIPLEKITDIGLVQGPLMRLFGLHKLTVETAGQSGQGALVSLTGIVNTQAFRELILQQKEALLSNTGSSNVDSNNSESSGSDQLLTEIRDALLRIETKMQKSQ